MRLSSYFKARPVNSPLPSPCSQWQLGLGSRNFGVPVSLRFLLGCEANCFVSSDTALDSPSCDGVAAARATTTKKTRSRRYATNRLSFSEGRQSIAEKASPPSTRTTRTKPVRAPAWQRQTRPSNHGGGLPRHVCIDTCGAAPAAATPVSFASSHNSLIPFRSYIFARANCLCVYAWGRVRRQRTRLLFTLEGSPRQFCCLASLCRRQLDCLGIVACPSRVFLAQP